MRGISHMQNHKCEKKVTTQSLERGIRNERAMKLTMAEIGARVIHLKSIRNYGTDEWYHNISHNC